MRPTIAICCTIKSIIDFHRSRLEHPSQGGNNSVTAAGKYRKPPGGGGDIPHSPTQFRPIRSHPTTAKILWIDFHRLLWVRRRYQRRNDLSPPPPWKNYSLLGGGGDIPHSPTHFRPIRSHLTTTKTSWINFHRLLWVRRRYQRLNEPPPPHRARATDMVFDVWRGIGGGCHY